MSKGGRTSTTWDKTWNLGKTKVIRVPEVLEAEVIAYARARDKGESLLQGNIQDEILNAIANYIIYRAGSRHANQHGKTVDVSARTWDELRKFAKLVEEQPQLLGLDE